MTASFLYMTPSTYAVACQASGSCLDKRRLANTLADAGATTVPEPATIMQSPIVGDKAGW